MRICIVSNYKKNGYGESTRPYHLSLNLLKQGHKILHLCEYDGVEGDIRYVKVNTAEWEPNIIKRLFQFIILSFKIRAFNADILYVHQFNNARWALMTKLLPKRKFVYDAHTSVYFEQSFFNAGNKGIVDRAKQLEREICSKADYIISASEETREILKTTYDLDENKLFVVGNATDMLPVTTPERNAKDRGKMPFTCIATLPFDGFISNELALAYLFEIAALVQKENPQIRFVVLGGGKKPAAPTLNIEYAGYVQDLRKEILAADICLMPYPDNAVCGGARNKFCDFIALGKVVISSPEGMRGMHILEPGKNCLLANNKYEYAAQIIELRAHADKISTLESEVFKISGYYSWQDRAMQVEGIFKEILHV